MTNKFIKQYNYAEMSVLNVKSIKVTNGENKDNFLSRDRQDIRLNPVPAGYPASISGSGFGPVSKNFAGFFF